MKRLIAVITLIAGIFIMLLSYRKSKYKIKVIDF